MTYEEELEAEEKAKEGLTSPEGGEGGEGEDLPTNYADLMPAPVASAATHPPASLRPTGRVVGVIKRSVTHPPTHPCCTAAHSNRLLFLYPPTHPPTSSI